MTNYIKCSNSSLFLFWDFTTNVGFKICVLFCLFVCFSFLNPALWLCSKSWSTWLSKYLVFSSFILKSEFCNLGSLKVTHSLLGSDDWKKIIHIWYKGREEGMAIYSSILAWRSPMDGGAWQAAVHGVTKSQTRLSD